MKILNILASGNTGGIEVLCKNILFSSKEDNRVCFLFSHGKVYDDMMKKKPEKIISYSTFNKNIFRIVNEITKYCKNEKIDIIVMHPDGLLCNIVYVLLKKKNPKVKFVRYIHSCFDKYGFRNSDNLLKNKLIKIYMQKAINVSDSIIFVSDAAKMSFIKNFKIEDSKIKRIYNGADDIFYEKPLNLQRNSDKIRLIFIGRLSIVKGVDILLHAFSKLDQNKYELTIVGDGVEKQNLETIVKKLNITNVKFVGRQESVIEWLDNADIFVYPSICEESFGISVVEAMSRGCIPITFKKGGLPEIIINGKNGFLVDNINSDDLSKTIDTILITKELIDNAIDTSKRFSLKNTINELEEYYKKLLN